MVHFFTDCSGFRPIGPVLPHVSHIIAHPASSTSTGCACREPQKGHGEVTVGFTVSAVYSLTDNSMTLFWRIDNCTKAITHG